MPWGLRRFQEARCQHFITFSCYRRAALLSTPQARRTFEQTLEQVRRWYAFYVTGYVVMPEHVHLLISEPERGRLSTALQMLKQIVTHQLSPGRRFWQPRYYDFNVWSERKCVEKLRYLHRNPVTRGLVERPEDWESSSFRHYVTGAESMVEIESHWTAKKREQMGVFVQFAERDQRPTPRPVPPKNGATRTGHPRV